MTKKKKNRPPRKQAVPPVAKRVASPARRGVPKVYIQFHGNVNMKRMTLEEANKIAPTVAAGNFGCKCGQRFGTLQAMVDHCLAAPEGVTEHLVLGAIAHMGEGTDAD